VEKLGFQMDDRVDWSCWNGVEPFEGVLGKGKDFVGEFNLQWALDKNSKDVERWIRNESLRRFCETFGKCSRVNPVTLWLTLPRTLRCSTTRVLTFKRSCYNRFVLQMCKARDLKPSDSAVQIQEKLKCKTLRYSKTRKLFLTTFWQTGALQSFYLIQKSKEEGRVWHS
jgi:hypothetical protein